ncbi:hypothetical protein [Marmoricola sp. OAE513]|uniref:hypothetical protein n=1 Tax=Marmoricola sp. OAE513 TaxID=2817894 RepID=UPI00339340FD
MLSRSRLLVAALLCALTYTGLTMAPAQAASVPKVTSVAYAGQNSATGQIKVKWKKVKGAKYQLRWAPSSSKLKSAKLYSSTATSAYSPVLSNRCVSWYVQVRAIKKGKKGKFSTPKAVKLKVGYPTKPVGSQINTTTQTDPTSAQIRWSTTANVAKARLHWSAAPFEKWIGFDNRTAFTTGHSLSIKLPASPVPGDRTISPAYGNPIFGELEVSNGCTSSLPSTAYVAMFPKPADPGNASTGDALAVASYNVGEHPDGDEQPDEDRQHCRQHQQPQPGHRSPAGGDPHDRD